MRTSLQRLARYVGLTTPALTRMFMRPINSYAEWVAAQWKWPGEDPLVTLRDDAIMGLGVSGEAGEVAAVVEDLLRNALRLCEHSGKTAEVLKKHIRDGEIDRQKLMIELGDTIFYWARICERFGIRPSDVLAANVAKLEDRRARGVLRGSGDSR